MNKTLELKNRLLNKARVTVTSIWSKRLPSDEPVRYTIEFDKGATDEETLEIAFRQTNRVDGTELISTLGIKAPSSSMGDIFCLNGAFYMVDGCGFREITEAEYDKAVTLTSRDLGFGYEIAKKEGLL